MPSKLVIVPNNMGSKGAKALADTLSAKLNYKVYRVTDQRVRKRIAFKLREGTDKLTQFQRFTDAKIPIPDFTTDPGVARGWTRDGAVVCRTLLRGSEGRGIVIAETPEQVVNAPLYTRYVKKKKEFRVHVFDGQVIDVQEKRKRSGFEGDRDSRVRNLHNGYVFCRGNIEEPAGLRELGVKAAQSLGYRLGAVDIAFNERGNSCYVLEVNATPGMEGSTLEKYSEAIINWYKEQV